ncbi:ATP-binding cassette domain-containing protein [Alkalitalea saponilacus]|uniref:ABC-type multidrug transport system, ATPase component n=1 Tax=Alkalitalea saponilacus TaxID=889453 RepID=A0A1T5F8N4_9BACT|nr:ATP-binding cassette domain-containing protein [Alkalitalea saponilacus]ASB50132.1 hypothetical protein CDL62_13785 [Alkalitalea saponilacus]SKB92506.1 ABC-type multidrug transport system, ATPase component [Alkalitalea saponilacus]
MKEKALQSIVSIFALIAVFKPGKGYTLISNILEVYLSSNFTKQTTDIYLDKFHQRIKEYIQVQNKKPSVFHHYFTNEIEAHCYILSREITISQRMLVLIYLIEYAPYMSGKTSLYITSEATELVRTIAGKLEIDQSDFNDALAFSTDVFQKISDRNPLLIISDNQNLSIPGTKISHVENLNGQLIFLKISSINTVLFKVSGQAHFEINNRKLYKRRTYILNKGAVIHTNNDFDFYYNDITKALTRSYSGQKLALEAHNIDYRFRNGNYGIRKMSFSCHSGEMLAIMGGSGSGKTTLMNLLIGARKPENGVVTLNGVNVFTNPDKVKGYIGYVPQDDALNEELTAFENLYFIAGLSSGNLSKNERIRKVNKILKELDLFQIKDLKVGSPLEKVISGGQRKRLNIAIELVRDPGILFLDEPTSGLSSADSENIMQILKDATENGRMVIINIHQPSSDIFKMFDKLLFIDKGGYPVYFGPAIQVTSYLKQALKLADAHENECQTCGNLNPDDIFRFVQTTNIATPHRSGSKRVYTPERWHRRYMRSIQENFTIFNEKTTMLSPSKVDIPNKVKQFKLYSLRNLFTKLADYPYLILSLSLPPLLGTLLSVFSRYISPLTDSYSFHENENIPPYIFMSVIVAMFVGIMSGSTEIIKDRKALKRESFLNLSFSSYLGAKMFYLVTLSAVQMASYVLVSKWILQIPAGNISFFTIMWTTAIASGIIGLLLSTIFKTTASVYVSIPFILIPQILFSGAVIDFNKINPFFSSDKYVPPISEPMLSRWSFEAISVSLFMKSEYSNYFYDLDQSIYQTAYYRNFLIPELEKAFFSDTWSSDHSLTPDSANFALVRNGYAQLVNHIEKKLPELNDQHINGNDFNLFIREARNALTKINDSVQNQKDELINELGRDRYRQLQQTRNKKLAQIVSDETNVEKIRISEDQFIRKMTPIYFMPENIHGRSHLYSPAKRIGNIFIDTPRFCNYVIFTMSLVLLIVIYLNRPRY